MLSMTTTRPRAETGRINIHPILTQGVDFQCTPQYCYGVGPIHRVLQGLQQEINNAGGEISVDGFIGPHTKMVAERVAQIVFHNVKVDPDAARILAALQQGRLAYWQMAAFAVALTQLFKLAVALQNLE